MTRLSPSNKREQCLLDFSTLLEKKEWSQNRWIPKWSENCRSDIPVRMELNYLARLCVLGQATPASPLPSPATSLLLSNSSQERVNSSRVLGIFSQLLEKEADLRVERLLSQVCSKVWNLSRTLERLSSLKSPNWNKLWKKAKAWPLWPEKEIPKI